MQTEARNRADCGQGLLERALTADHGAHRDLRTGKVDRDDRDIDLPMR